MQPAWLIVISLGLAACSDEEMPTRVKHDPKAAETDADAGETEDAAIGVEATEASAVPDDVRDKPDTKSKADAKDKAPSVADENKQDGNKRKLVGVWLEVGEKNVDGSYTPRTDGRLWTFAADNNMQYQKPNQPAQFRTYTFVEDDQFDFLKNDVVIHHITIVAIEDKKSLELDIKARGDSRSTTFRYTWVSKAPENLP